MINCKKTVDDMYQYAKEEDSLLLSSFGAESEGFHFWDEYRSKHRRYDKLFNRMFNSFKYFMQKPNQTIAEITEDFTDEVYNHLMINAKKYEELYRLNVINDSNYSLVDNYNIVETLDKEVETADTNIYGSRTDNNQHSIGAKTDSRTETLGGYTDTTESEYGARTDETENVIGSKTDTVNETLGGTVNSVENTKGEQVNATENGISGFNSAVYSDDTNRNETLGERTDTSEETLGSRTNTRSDVYGSQTNTAEFTKGEQSDSVSEVHGSRNNTENISHGAQTITDANVKGQQTDSLSGSVLEEYTLTRKGINGEHTITELLKQHKSFWTVYEFYTFIFKEICAELLSI